MERQERIFGAAPPPQATLMEAMTGTSWVKASASNDDDICVEQRRNGDMIEIRDTKDNGTGPILRFTEAEFAAWLDGAKKGEFDHLI